MSFVPRFKIYDSTGLTLLYTLEAVQSTNHPYSSKEVIEIRNQRAKGSIIIDGGTEAWDLIISGILLASNYKALTVKIDALESAIAFNTPYIVKIDKTESTCYEYKVKRIISINFPESFRNVSQEYRLTLRVNSW